MSRHRAIRNLDLDDELDDEAIDSGGEEEEYDDMTQDQADSMATSFRIVHEVLGSNTTITDREIKRALWNYFFDTESSIAFLLDENHKKETAKAKANDLKLAKAKASQPTTNNGNKTKSTTPMIVPRVFKKNLTVAPTPVASTSKPTGTISQLQSDLEGMNLIPSASAMEIDEEYVPTGPVVSLATEKILELVREREKDEKPVLSLVVVGHVDAGKSTLMGRVLHELGVLSDRTLAANQRSSQKMGKGSFAYAWTFDAMDEERERGVTIDVAIDTFTTPTKRFTLIDAPGHRDFIPNMISGAAQADTAVLVVDGATGAFEKGFEGGGQTREHALLVRSLGVQQLVVAVNKLDAVNWSETRFDAICAQLLLFLTQSGFHPSKVFFVPVGATTGVNLVEKVEGEEGLGAWYDGKTLVEQLDALEIPPRAIASPLRIPISNVFRGQSAAASGLAISGRIESGIVQVGERLACLPGDESGVVRSLEVEGDMVDWAVAGVNVTIYLSGIDVLQLSVGSILCPPSLPIPLAISFLAQIVIFELQYPITIGYAIELFHFSKDCPATVTKLVETVDRGSGEVLKKNPRLLTSNTSARVQITLRTPPSALRKSVIPLEPFSVNKSMGRVLLRRAGKTIAAGIVLEVYT